MPTFPAFLPAPLIEGYGLQPRDATIRSAMDGGTTRVRKRHTASGLTRVSVKWRISRADYALFDAWLETYGHDWFDITLAEGAAQARLVGDYTATLSGAAIWDIAAELEVKP